MSKTFTSHPSCWWPQPVRQGRPSAPIRTWSWSWPYSFRPMWRSSCLTYLLGFPIVRHNFFQLKPFWFVFSNLMFFVLSWCPYSCWRCVSFFPLPWCNKNESKHQPTETNPREANWPGYASILASCFPSKSVLRSSLCSDLGSCLGSTIETILWSCLSSSCCLTSCLGRTTCCCWGHLNLKNYIFFPTS